MKKRKITVNIDSTLKYLQLWNGILKADGIYKLNPFLDPNTKNVEVAINKI